MLLRKLVVVGLVGFVSFAANIALAEDAMAPSTSYIAGVNLNDPNADLPDRFQISLGSGEAPRFANLSPAEPSQRSDSRDRRYQVQVTARTGGDFDVQFAQRGGVGFNDQGDVNRQTRSSEVRLGRSLANMPRDRGSATPRWYIFAASEDEALIWNPGSRNSFGSSGGPSFALQDRVEIGDRQAGITYEVGRWQASFAYVEREIKIRAGGRNWNQDEDFTGVTLTMRH